MFLVSWLYVLEENLFDDALNKYNIVLNAGESDFKEDALAKTSQIYLEKQTQTASSKLLKKNKQRVKF